MTITYSELESKRFALPVYRAKSEKLNLTALHTFATQHPASLLIYRIPVSEQANLHLLQDLPARYLVADTLVYYGCDLRKHTIPPLKNDLHFRPAVLEDGALMNGLVADIFAGYTNHYFSNPLLDKTSIIAGYQEWVQSYLHTQAGNHVAFVVQKGDTSIGFATCAQHDEAVCEGVLYGVEAAHAGGGVYTDIIRFTQQYYQTRGLQKMRVSTQIQNFAVQKVWTREGFFLEEAFLTLHVMPQ